MRILASILFFSGAALAQEGDPAIGRALFTGERPFDKGGAACGACHAMGGQGPGLNASFAPDLGFSIVAQDLDMLDGVMAEQPYKTMKPLYAGRPISEQERAHILAWVHQVAGKEHAEGGAALAVQAGLLATVLFISMAVRKPRRSPREELERR